MAKRMLIDASHPEETRVVVLDGQKVEEFDFEAASKLPLKGNIYLAKVTRVEPSLQAAFVEYGGNRQGFLAFGEIHPDYYQIPVADRQALIAEQQAEARRRAEEEFEPVETGTAVLSDEELAAQDEADAAVASQNRSAEAQSDEELKSGEADENGDDEEDDAPEEIFDDQAARSGNDDDHEALHEYNGDHSDAAEFSTESLDTEEHVESVEHGEIPSHGEDSVTHDEEATAHDHADEQAFAPLSQDSQPDFGIAETTENILSENGDGSVEPDAAQPAQALQNARPGQRWVRKRHYKIQEVIKRRQIILVQVVKEERGNKGAALTTYLSLAGRYCVLMPNTPRGGGISRKITNANDRKRLKSAAAALELPEGMGLIIRTAGENRTKVEIKRDYEYLLRMWDTIRETTLNSNAPARVYEEGDLIKRAIRDLYNKDVGEVVVEGDDGYRNAKDFMRTLMPSHAKNVKQYKAPTPLFQSQHIEAQLDAMFQPTVTLKSGGYIVINQTEALVSIDVNSGRATREHSIEETAHKTNLEAADEIGRQLRLRDLAGLIVIDFIDMEDGRNDRHVEKRLRDAVKNDRARIQIGKISQFGLMEMSRQRLRAGVVAGSTVPCPHCGGQGIVRSVESTALRVLRGLEEEGQKLRSASVNAYVPSDVAFYTLNQKRRELQRIETDYHMAINLVPKNEILAGNFEIERTAQLALEDRPSLPVAEMPPPEETIVEAPTDLSEEVEETEEHEDLTHAEPLSQSAPNGEGNKSGRRRRRRRGRSGSQQGEQPQQASEQPAEQSGASTFSEDRFGGNDDVPDTTPKEYAPLEATHSDELHDGQSAGLQQNGNVEGAPRKRRRRRRGGRNRHGNANHHQDGQFPMQDGNGPIQTSASSDVDELAAPNTPVESTPSFHVDELQQPSLVPSHAAEREPVQHDAVKSEPPEAPAPVEPARKGWWQRTFST